MKASRVYSVLLTVVGCGQYFVFAEQERQAPDSRESNNCVDNTADNRALTAENPSHNIKLKKTDRAPVDCTDYNEN